MKVWLRVCLVVVVFAGVAEIALAKRGAKTPPPPTVTPSTPVARLELPPWRERHEKKLSEVKAHPFDVVYLGDSITERLESGEYKPIWDHYNHGRRALDLGFSGDTTGNLLWRITEGDELNGLRPQVVVLLIGTNNTSEKHPDWTAGQTVEAIDKILDEVRMRAPHVKIIVLSILPADRGKDKDALDDAINADLASKYAPGVVAGVEYLDVSPALEEQGRLRTCLYADPRSNPPQGAVHPTPLGQSYISAMLEPLLARDLGESPKAPMHMSDPLCPSERASD